MKETKKSKYLACAVSQFNLKKNRLFYDLVYLKYYSAVCNILGNYNGEFIFFKIILIL